MLRLNPTDLMEVSNWIQAHMFMHCFSNMLQSYCNSSWSEVNDDFKHSNNDAGDLPRKLAVFCKRKLNIVIDGFCGETRSVLKKHPNTHLTFANTCKFYKVWSREAARASWQKVPMPSKHFFFWLQIRCEPAPHITCCELYCKTGCLSMHIFLSYMKRPIGIERGPRGLCSFWYPSANRH